MPINFDKSPQMLSPNPIPVQTLHHPVLTKKQVQLTVLRLDQVHEEVSGNKFFKLKYNLEEAKKQGKTTVLSFGGAFSNHILALSAAAKLAGLSSIGIIRGEENSKTNPTLSKAEENGMRLHFVSREEYRHKTVPKFIEALERQFGDFYLIPEGGTNTFAIQGTREIWDQTYESYSHIAVSIGTGGTFAGIADRIQDGQTLMGFPALKGAWIKEEIDQLLQTEGIIPKGRLQIIEDYHFGGYAKWKPELIEFIRWFWREFQIPLDPIYTGKMAFGLWDLIVKDFFPCDSAILMIHTGGLQGIEGFTARTGEILPQFQ